MMEETSSAGELWARERTRAPLVDVSCTSWPVGNEA